MAKVRTSYEAYCLTCCGGGKTLGTFPNAQYANAAATGHMGMGYGCNVTVIKR